MFCPKNYSANMPKIDRLIICTFPLKGKLEVVGVCGLCHWMYVFPTKEDRVLDDLHITHTCKNRQVKVSHAADLSINLAHADEEILLKNSIAKVKDDL
jgi:hypothetical protein